MKVHPQDRLPLAQGLRLVAQKYFDGEELVTRCGICMALDHLWDKDGVSYALIESLMNELDEPDCYFDAYSRSRERWAPRAYMCLILADYLEGTAA